MSQTPLLLVLDIFHDYGKPQSLGIKLALWSIFSKTARQVSSKGHKCLLENTPPMLQKHWTQLRSSRLWLIRSLNNIILKKKVEAGIYLMKFSAAGAPGQSASGPLGPEANVRKAAPPWIKVEQPGGQPVTKKWGPQVLKLTQSDCRLHYCLLGSPLPHSLL